MRNRNTPIFTRRKKFIFGSEAKKDDVDQVWLHYGDSTIFEDSGKYQYRVLMRKVAADDLHDYWLANVRVDYRRLLYLLK